MTDSFLIAQALDQWANYIETGEVIISANDAVAANQHKKIRALGDDQRNLVSRLRALAKHYRGLEPLGSEL